MKIKTYPEEKEIELKAWDKDNEITILFRNYKGELVEWMYLNKTHIRKITKWLNNQISILDKK